MIADLSDPSTLPFVFQTTESPNVFSITDPSDSVVRSNQYFEVIGRSSSNASQLFHQKVIASRLALTFDNLVAAYERLANQYNSSGDSLGIAATHLIVGNKHVKALKAMVKDTAVVGSPIIQLESNDFISVRSSPYMNFTPPV
jgi:phage major head subunit gpT-like protein